MKKLILLLALISSLAFGIEKKTPSGNTVKDKPGKVQTTFPTSYSYNHAGSTTLNGVVSGIITWNIERIGNVVFLMLKGTGVFTANSVAVSAPIAITAPYLPNRDQIFPMILIVAGTPTAVSFYFHKAGSTLYFYPNAAQGNWSGQTLQLGQDTCVSWIID